MGSRFTTLVELWEATQVELHGRYTTDRVLELAKYSRETSWFRIVGVLLATPLPCLAVTVLSDVLPLAGPSEGVDANYMFLIREFYCYLVMNFLSIQQFRTSVPVLPYPIKSVVRTTIILSTLCVGVYYGCAQAIGFPVPFSTVTVMPTWVVFISASLVFEWKKNIGETPGAGTMVLNVMKVWMCQVLLVLIYPPYFYIFTTLSDEGQTGFALLLPVIKVLMRNVFVRTVVHLRDELPEVVVFNIEVFNALFVAYCMQSSPSIWTTLELMLADVVLLGLSLRDIDRASRGLEELALRIEQGRNLETVTNPHAHMMLERASTLLRQEVNSEVTTYDELPRKWSSQGPGLVNLADARPERNNTTQASFVVMARDACSTFSLAPHPLRAAKQLLVRGRILPVHEGAAATGSSFPRAPVKLSYTRKVRRLLYMAEFVLLLNYVEAIIPLVFSIYLAVMYQLPNRDYYAQLNGMNQEQLFLTLKHVLSYCSFQILSLLVLTFMLHRKLGLSPIRQLAFVLDKHAAGAQIKLVFWVLYNVQASLQHSGYDYTFKFAWLHQVSMTSSASNATLPTE